MRTRISGWGVAVAALAFLLAACDGKGGPTAQGSGKVSIALTDAPADSITAAVVTISDIYLQRGQDSTSASERVYLRQNTVTTVNLLTLRDSLRSLVQSATVPAGSYSQLRFVVTGAYIQVRTASGGSAIYATSNTYSGLPAGAQVTGTLVAPSWATSGLKVILPGGSLEVGDGSTTSLVADFDVAQSFGHEAGNSGRWVLSPVIKAAAQNTLASLTVNVGLGTGANLPTGVALTGFQVQLEDASGNLRTAPLVVGGGAASATFQALAPGNGPFQVTLVAPAGFKVATSSPTLPATLTLAPGANTQAITLTSVTAG